MIVDLRPDHLEIVKRILAERVPEYQVRAFGSRARWTAKDTSDLDLVVMTDAPLGLARLADLREAFSESDLPFRVDVLDWAATGVEFREIIEQDDAVIQQPGSTGSSGPTWRRLGMAGEQYPMVPLGDVAEIFDSMRIPVKKADRKPGPYPYYGASGIVDYVDSYIFDGEYLLFAEDGENLRSQNTPIAFMATGKFWVNNHAHILQGNASGVTRFLCYALQIADVKSYLSGSTRPKLTQGDMKQIPIPCPPVDTQQAIACILGTLDDKIELNRRMNETLEGMARAIFKSWFVDFDPVRAKAQRKDAEAQRRKEKQGQDSFASWRLGGSALNPAIADLFPDAFEASELGEIPKGWEVTGLYAVATLKKESVKPMRAPAKLWEHYSIPAFDAGRIPVVETGTNIKSSKYRVPIASVLVSKLNPRFPRVWLPDVQDEEAAICSTEFMPFVPLHNAWRPFLYELIKSDAVQQGIQERVTGSTGSRQRARPKDVAEMHVIVPSTELIETFGRTVGPLHEKTLTCICESRTLAALRDTLLPKLISGELRIPDAERIVGRCV